jgi:hypothetical protein
LARKKGVARPPSFESIVTDPSQSFKWHQHDCPSNIARWNYHPEYEIHLITRSHGHQFVGDYIGEFSPGNLVLAGSNLPHNWMSDLQPSEVIEGRDMSFSSSLICCAHGPTSFPNSPILSRF